MKNKSEYAFDPSLNALFQELYDGQSDSKNEGTKDRYQLFYQLNQPTFFQDCFAQCL